METVRDLAIIFLAITNLVALLVLIFLALQVIKLIRTIQSEVPTIFSSAKKTMDSVQGTTSFVGRTAAMPLIRVASAAAAATRFAQVILGLDKDKRR